MHIYIYIYISRHAVSTRVRGGRCRAASVSELHAVEFTEGISEIWF